MLVCSNCKKENATDSTFCGYCGASLFDAGVILDGKKNRKRVYLINKIYNSFPINILYIAASVIASLLFGVLLFYSVSEVVGKYDALGYHIGQIAAKYDYVKEGMGFSYISSSVMPIISYIQIIILGILSLVNLPVLVFNAVLGSYILYCKRKISVSCSVKKPVTMVRINILLIKWTIIADVIIAGLFVLTAILKIYF